MKKIMFNDKYGLTDAVLQGRKTMTRRVCKEYATQLPILYSDVESFRFYQDENIVEFLLLDGTTKVSVPPYKIGEVVAVAQSYSSFRPLISHNDDFSPSHPGWNNKMFVRADLMPHQIRFTDFNIEPLQDISDEDCLKEGVYMRTEQHPRQEFEPEYTFGEGKYHAQNPRAAFADLIDKPGVGGKGTWERNPWVFVYTFKLIK